MNLYDPNCKACRLHESALSVCIPATGSKRSFGMIVGEAPGAREDARNTPFIGQAGMILNSALERAGLSRTEVFVTNAVKCRPRANRTPYVSEIDTCVDLYLKKEISFVAPRAILACGNVACEAVLDMQGITELRGKWMRCTHAPKIPVMPTWHPAALLYDQTKEPEFFRDVKRFVKGLKY